MVKPPPNSVHPKTRAKRRNRMEKQHTQDERTWLIRYKKATGCGHAS